MEAIERRSRSVSRVCGYVGKGSVTYTCETQPRVQCRANYICIGGGPIRGGSLGWSVYGFAVEAPDSANLAGWSNWQVTGNISFAGFQAPWAGGVTVSPGIGAGAGIALIKCNTYNLSCTDGSCTKQ